jgi:23S rRNA (pseudouridine1915-N3)-methyltransferase
VKIFVYFIGKPKDIHANAMADDFMARVCRFCKAEMREIRPERADPWEKHPTARKILLDPAGRLMDSGAFAAAIRDAGMRGRDLVFAIGGHDGFPAGWRERADLVASLGRITLPHELARVVLAEQIYRAFTMLRGHPYPR